MPQFNTNDGTARPPRLRFDLNIGSISDVPEWSTAPRGDALSVHRALRDAGFEGVQGGDRAACAELGLRRTGWGQVLKPDDAMRIADEALSNGFDCAPVHVGTGFEDDATAVALLKATVAASARNGIPLYVETHRATVTNDPWRTLRLLEAVPDVRFNADLSHWYTGAEMHYGDLERKFELLAPVFDRVRFVHGRIGSPGCIQVDIGDGGAETEALPFVQHFREMWTRCFVGFLRSARPGDYISFTPELLPSSIFYARRFRGPDGVYREDGDRWQQSLLYMRIAEQSFEVARQRTAR